MAGKISFVDVKDTAKYKEAYEKAHSVAIAEPGLMLCSLSRESKCIKPNPSPQQFVDTNKNGKLDDGEFSLSLGALFKTKCPPKRLRLCVSNFLLSPDVFRGDAEMEELVLGGITESNGKGITLKNPMVSGKKGEKLPATIIRGLKVYYTQDNKLIVGFELVHKPTNTASLKIFLQQ